MMVWAPEIPPGPHLLADMDSSLTFASQVPIDVTDGWAASLGKTGPHLYSWVD